MSKNAKFIPLLEACAEFEKKNISLEELQSKINTHGSASTGLYDWYDFLNNLEEECALILRTERLADHYTLGLKVSEKIKKYLMENINNMH